MNSSVSMASQVSVTAKTSILRSTVRSFRESVLFLTDRGLRRENLMDFDAGSADYSSIPNITITSIAMDSKTIPDGSKSCNASWMIASLVGWAIVVVLFVCLMVWWKRIKKDEITAVKPLYQKAGEKVMTSGCGASSCSRYDVFKDNTIWTAAQTECGGDLVAMESEEEWNFLKSKVKQWSYQNKYGQRWHIGLRKRSDKWCWTTRKDTCMEVKVAPPRWSSGEPNNLQKEHCVEMLKDGFYNNIECSRNGVDTGYICERKIDCSNSDTGNNIFKSPNTTEPKEGDPTGTKAINTFISSTKVAKGSKALNLKPLDFYKGAIPEQQNLLTANLAHC
ncbi:uncharacterized protein [Montipora foliosa]|uniref:uncharacterized protein n=1 Tax=Montipora foliosa TaxID=591990 RepID=UPI0035F1D358